MNECCRNCVFCVPMAQEECVCDCEESEGYGLSIDPDDYCGEFQERREK